MIISNNVQHSEFKKRLYNINDQLTLQKISYAFFADRYYSRESKSLFKYEFNPGSLTAASFRDLLIEFKNSHPNLRPESLAIIKDFIQSLERGSDQWALIDQTRSHNWRLFLFVRLKYTLWKEEQNFSSFQTIDSISERVMEILSELPPNESVCFLAGNIYHETCIRIKKEKDSYSVWVCDSAEEETLKVFHPKREDLESKEFWNQIFTAKFSSKPIEWTQTEKLILGPNEENPEINAGKIKKQSKNTCHFKSQWAVLKGLFFIEISMELFEARQEWKNFKIQFGEFLLQKDLGDRQLRKVCEITHQKRDEAQDKPDIFLDYQEGQAFREACNAYKQAYDYFGLEFTPFKKNLHSSYYYLRLLHNDLISKLLKIYLPFEMIDAYFKNSNNECLNYTFKTFEDRLSHHFRKKWGAGRSSSFVQATRIGNWYKKIAGIIEFEEPEICFHPTSAAKMEEILKQLESNNYSYTQHEIKSVLLQAIHAGKIDRVAKIFTTHFKKNRNYILTQTELLSNLVPSLLDRSVEEYVKKNPKDHFAGLLRLIVVKKTLIERRFEDFLTIVPSNPSLEYRKTIRNSTFNEETLKSALSFLQRKEHLSSEYYNDVLFAVAKHFIYHNSFESFLDLVKETADPNSTFILFDGFSLKALNQNDTLKWFEFYKENQSAHTLFSILNYVLGFNLYHHNLFDELEQLDKFEQSNHRNIIFKNLGTRRCFRNTKLTLENIERVIKYLDKSKYWLKPIIFNDLINLINDDKSLSIKDKGKKLIFILNEIDDLEYIEKDLMKFHPSSIPTLVQIINAPDSEISRKEKWNKLFLKFYLQNEHFDLDRVNFLLTDLYNQEVPLKDIILPCEKISKSEFYKKNPDSTLSKIVQNRLILDEFHKSVASSKAFNHFMIKWKNWLSMPHRNLPHDLVIFDNEEPEKLFKVWEFSPPSPELRDAFALLFINQGRKDLALWVYPDSIALEKLIQS